MPEWARSSPLSTETPARTATATLQSMLREAPSHLFFQNALRDEAVMREDALAYQAAGSEPKQIEWYESSHFLPDEAF
ncbi:MAG TPA: hypothetical protein VJ830_09930 [Anaerolineales bacterium]|nr:hypothetical protein [Anaerolineales bacterium]